MGDFPLCQEFRDHTQNRAAAFKHGIGDDAHDADPAASEDQSDASLRETMAQDAAGFGVNRVHADARTTKYGE
jgi:hypothetical protein